MDLYEALWQRNFKRVRELVTNGAELNTYEIWAPLCIAAFVGEVKIVKYLLAHGAIPTPDILHHCVRYECEPHIFKRLLKTGIDVNQYPELLVNAVRFGRHRLVARLLDAGADPNIPEADGTTALMMAAYYAHINLLEKLWAHGVDINQRDNTGENALFYAILWAAPLPVFKWLVEHGIDLQARTKKGVSVLQWLYQVNEPAVNPRNEIANYLISCGAKL